MGNVLLFCSGTNSALASDINVYGFRAAIASDMQAQVQAALVTEIGNRLLDMSINGSGQTKQFEVKMVTAPAGLDDPISASYKVFFYQGASRPELQAAADAALAAIVADAEVDEILGHGIAGGSQGRPYMGFFLADLAAG